MNNAICVLPWIHLSTRNDGTMRLCCQFHGNVGTRLGRVDFVEEFAGEEFELYRRQMLAGHLPKGCSKCVQQESLGLESKRQRENRLWSAKLGLGNLERELRTFKPRIRYADLRLSNRCNSTCQTCSAIASSAILERNRAIDKSLLPIGHTYDDERASKIENWAESAEFWGPMERVDLKSVYLTGGEPMLNPRLPEFLRRQPPELEVRLNTNVTVINEELLKELHRFEVVILTLSVDALGPLNEFIRPPFKWSTVSTRLERYVALPRPFYVVLGPTVSIYNILHVPDYIRGYFRMQREHPHLELFLNLLMNPEYHRASLLRADLKRKVRTELAMIEVPKGIPQRERLLNQISSIQKHLDIEESDRDLRMTELKKYLSGVEPTGMRRLSEFYPEVLS